MTHIYKKIPGLNFGNEMIPEDLYDVIRIKDIVDTGWRFLTFSEHSDKPWETLFRLVRFMTVEDYNGHNVHQVTATVSLEELDFFKGRTSELIKAKEQQAKISLNYFVKEDLLGWKWDEEKQEWDKGSVA